MRHTLLFLLLLVSFSASAQFRPSPYFWKYYGIKTDSLLVLPKILTDPLLLESGAIRYDGSHVQVYDGSSWGSVGDAVNIYNSDGTLTGGRQVHLNDNQLQFVNDGSSSGQTLLNFFGTGISITANPNIFDPNTNFSGALTISTDYHNYLGSEGRNRLTHMESDTLSANLLFNRFDPSGAPIPGYENRAGVDSTGFFFQHGYRNHPSEVNTTLLKIDSIGLTTLSHYKNTAGEDSVLTTDVNGLLKMKYLSSSLWDSTKIKDSVILNRSASIQAANFSISGNGAASKLTAYQSSATTFSRYLVFSHGATDTTTQRWAIGVQGTGGGGPSHVGDSLVFRSYTTAGAFLGDRLTLSRGGKLTVNSALIGSATPAGVGGVSGSFTVTGSEVIGVDLAVGGNLYTGAAISQAKTNTVTTDYTVGVTDLYINVNNSANCTITIPTANSGTKLDGRLLYIKKISNNAFTVTIVVSGGVQTIDGGSSVVISSFNDHVMLHDDGSNWFTY